MRKTKGTTKHDDNNDRTKMTVMTMTKNNSNDNDNDSKTIIIVALDVVDNNRTTMTTTEQE